MGANSNPLKISGKVVQVMEYAFDGNLTLHRVVALTLKGGYDRT